jgi:glycosyltransferase involved in cell wall biosynthesis
MRVTILHGSNDVYGASRVLLDEVAALQEIGHHVTVALPSRGPLTAALEDSGAVVHIDPKIAVLRRSRIRDALRLPTLPAYVRDADLVVLWTLALALYAPLLVVRRKQFYFSVHELLLGRFGSALVRTLVVSNTAPVFACSRAVAEWLAGLGVARNRLHVTYPAFTWSVREALPRSGRFTVAVVGRVNGHKGHREVAEAFIAGFRDRPTWRLLLVGSPYPGQEAAFEEIRLLVEGYDSVEMLGEVPGFRSISEHVDLVACFPDRPEPFGLVPVEAWAEGVRAAGFDDGGAAEVLRVVDGVRVRRQDEPVQAIGEALEAAWESRMSWKAPSVEEVSSVFSSEERRSRLEAVMTTMEKK